MKSLNEEIHDDMKIDLNITWLDIAQALLGWIAFFATAPYRWLVPQHLLSSNENDLLDIQSTQ